MTFLDRPLDRLRGLFRRATPDFDAPLAPDEPIAVIGDVHGRHDLLSRMLEVEARLKRGSQPKDAFRDGLLG